MSGPLAIHGAPVSSHCKLHLQDGLVFMFSAARLLQKLWSGSKSCLRCSGGSNIYTREVEERDDGDQVGTTEVRERHGASPSGRREAAFRAPDRITAYRRAPADLATYSSDTIWRPLPCPRCGTEPYPPHALSIEPGPPRPTLRTCWWSAPLSVDSVRLRF